MMTIKTVPGKTYAVTSSADCTVTTPDGLAIVACTAGAQMIFVAPTAEVQISDDAALVTESFKGASLGSSAGGGVKTFYETAVQTPPEGALDNYDAYGWAMAVHRSGRLDTITVQPRSIGFIRDMFPIYLKIWMQQGNQWKLVGTSINAVVQEMGTPYVWRFRGVQLEAGQKLHIDAHRTPDSDDLDSRLSVRVVANTQADTGIIDWSGAVAETNWVPQYALAISHEAGLEANGIQLAEQSSLDAHAQDAVKHISGDERTTWKQVAECFEVIHDDGGDSGKESDTRRLQIESTMWGGEPQVVVTQSGDKAILSHHSLSVSDYAGATQSVDLRVLIPHPENATVHLDASERAALDEWMKHKDELLALLTQ